jgi:8-oxo-dGTP pyrophosphatase MutT (NUDIX family)
MRAGRGREEIRELLDDLSAELAVRAQFAPGLSGETAVRETKEETGIDSRSRGLVGI